MIEKIIDGWWQVLALLAGIVAGIWALIFGAVHFIKQARKSGVDEISAGPVKVDFEDSNDSKGV
jgi:hypothetical protein